MTQQMPKKKFFQVKHVRFDPKNPSTKYTGGDSIFAYTAEEAVEIHYLKLTKQYPTQSIKVTC